MLHRAVAIKELTAALYVTESEWARLFARTDAEARAAARINHSAVVTVHDVLDHDNRPWIVMELVDGASLADAVKERGHVESQEAARIGLWVLRALRAAHEAGVLHRDVKPGNVLLAEDGRVLLTDFGGLRPRQLGHRHRPRWLRPLAALQALEAAGLQRSG